MSISNILNFFKLSSSTPYFLAVKNSDDDIDEPLDFQNLSFPSKKIFLPAIDPQTQFKTLFQTHHRQIFKLCFQVTRDHQTAEDITIEVFAQLYRKLVCEELEEWNVNITFADYLHKLAVSELIDYQQQHNL